ncbi:galactose-1-phosphate uridylyltransferase [candidate division KSB3 bacterium]|uniref:Galactose-1-phosphate uridylyltransferase n=1 Tax=candidate division KSB3 bacterium TaxID=2044937 RepID=A0A2G6E4L1_9BACT|nr:MAG: galactose-1-phosphate uridylyltransferase [candidate division KSB3 bacterium]PIE29698.1 MAG: galactose-1-phosphate uridylyltransferase [candidate division KSB3 bacterium]
MPELRKDPISGRWVIISTERGKRPSDFGSTIVQQQDGFCPFCPGNEATTPHEVMAYRPDGSPPDSEGWSLRVVPNKFPALQIEGDLQKIGEGLFDKMNGIGAHEVLIESPEHEMTLSSMEHPKVVDMFWAFRERVVDLKRDRRFKYIMMFKNYGSAAGASLEHPHSQLIALPVVPLAVLSEMDGAKTYFDYKDRCVFCDIIYQETCDGSRVVSEHDDFLVVCPYAPRFPFETWILPKAHTSVFENSSREQFANLAHALQNTIRRLDNVLEDPPYNFIIHNAPLHHEHDVNYYHWHMEIMPKLAKVAGFEWGTGFYINPTPPEDAAKFLREASA